MEQHIGYDPGFHALLMSMIHNSSLQKIINDTRLLIRIFSIHRGGHDLQALKGIHQYRQQILGAVAVQKRETSLQQSMPTFFNLHRMTPQR